MCELVLKQAALVRELRKESAFDLGKTIETDGTTDWNLLNKAYERCGEVCAEYAKTFYLGTLRALSISDSKQLCLTFKRIMLLLLLNIFNQEVFWICGRMYLNISF